MNVVTGVGSEYRCGACGQMFEQGRADADAAAEAAKVFTPAELADAELVCDPCWTQMRQAMPDFDQRCRQAGL